MSLVDLFKRPSEDDGDLPQPLSDHDLLDWSAELALIPETDDFTVVQPQRRRTPLKAAPVPQRRRRPLQADPA